MPKVDNFNYKGLWRPKPKNLSSMNRKELLKELRSFRNKWENFTSIHQDLDDVRLKEEDDKTLRLLLKFYYSKDAKTIAKNKILQKEKSLLRRLIKMFK